MSDRSVGRLLSQSASQPLRRAVDRTFSWSVLEVSSTCCQRLDSLFSVSTSSLLSVLLFKSCDMACQRVICQISNQCNSLLMERHTERRGAFSLSRPVPSEPSLGGRCRVITAKGRRSKILGSSTRRGRHTHTHTHAPLLPCSLACRLAVSASG